jgi:4-amino-4-deoxy-L-arabinose transferase-like glycosyltransferase
VVVVYGLARELGASRKLALLPALVVAVFPSLLAYTVQPSREPAITLALAAGLLGLMRWFRGRRIRDLALGLGTLLFAGLIHSAFIVGLFVTVAYVVVEYSLRERRSLRGLTTAAVMGAAMSAAVATIAATGLGLGKIGFDVTEVASLSVIERVTDKGDIDARGGYLSEHDVRVESYADVARRLPERIALFLLKPYPWEVRSLADIVGVVIVATCIVTAAAFLLRSRTTRTGQWRFLALFLVVQLVLFSWGTVNYGTAARHKSKFVPILVVFLVAPARARDMRAARRTDWAPRDRFTASPLGLADAE